MRNCDVCLTELEYVEQLTRNNRIFCKECFEKDFASDFNIVQKSKDDGRHDVSDKSLKTLKKVMYSQDDFGMEKYGVPLKCDYNYNWLEMFLEEMADSFKYIQNEITMKETTKGLLETAIKHHDWEYVRLALKILNKRGTGKKEAE